VSTNWLLAAGFVSCYLVSITNFVLFTDKKCLLYQC